MADRSGGGGDRVTEAYRSAFAGLTEAPSRRVEELRTEGISRFNATGFPSPRDEEWRFTPITPLVRGVFAPAGPPSVVLAPEAISRFTFGTDQGPVLAFVNGRYAPELSRMPPQADGVVACSLALACLGLIALRFPSLRRAEPRSPSPETTDR